MTDMKITDPKAVELFVKFVHDINQYMKTVQNGIGSYHYKQGKIICNGRRQVTPYITAEPVYTKKNEVLKEIIDGISFSIYGTEFFQFHKEYKKNISEIEINDHYIVFKTNLPLVEIAFPNESDAVEAYDPTKLELIAKLDPASEEICREMVELKDNPVQVFMDAETGEIRLHDCPGENFLMFVYNKKYMVGMKATQKTVSGMELAIYDFNSEHNLYLIEMTVKAKELTIAHYMAVTDIVED
jgi:hypothetical protein